MPFGLKDVLDTRKSVTAAAKPTAIVLGIRCFQGTWVPTATLTAATAAASRPTFFTWFISTPLVSLSLNVLYHASSISAAPLYEDEPPWDSSLFRLFFLSAGFRVRVLDLRDLPDDLWVDRLSSASGDEDLISWESTLEVLRRRVLLEALRGPDMSCRSGESISCHSSDGSDMIGDSVRRKDSRRGRERDEAELRRDDCRSDPSLWLRE